MCECMKRADGTWHVDECCADIMNDYHSGKLFDSFKAQIRREVVEALVDLAYSGGIRHYLFPSEMLKWLAEQEASDGQQ